MEKTVDGYMQGLELLQYQRDFSIQLSSTSDLMEGLHASLAALLKVSGMDCGGIYLYDKTGSRRELVVHQGLDEKFVHAVSHYDGASDHAALINEGKPVYILHKDLEVQLTAVERDEGLLALAVLPLTDGESVIGCMNIGSHAKSDVPAAVRIAAETTAAQVGVALARMRARHELAQSEAHFRSLMESASNFAVYRLVADAAAPQGLRVLFISPSAKDILGIPDPMQFESWFEHMHPDDVDRIVKANLEAFETMKFDQQYRHYNNALGQWRWLHAISNAAIDSELWEGYVNGIMIDITEYKAVEEKLREHELELENRTKELNEAVTTLNVVLRNREKDQAAAEDKILSNLSSMVLPYLGRLKGRLQAEDEKTWLDIIESNLEEITSSFSSSLLSKKLGLTVIEIQVASLIKLGFTTKEIAAQMNVSPKTTSVHRTSIRKKLGLAQKKVNLRSYLMSELDA